MNFEIERSVTGKVKREVPVIGELGKRINLTIEKPVTKGKLVNGNNVTNTGVTLKLKKTINL